VEGINPEVKILSRAPQTNPGGFKLDRPGLGLGKKRCWGKLSVLFTETEGKVGGGRSKFTRLGRGRWTRVFMVVSVGLKKAGKKKKNRGKKGEEIAGRKGTRGQTSFAGQVHNIMAMSPGDMRWKEKSGDAK